MNPVRLDRFVPAPDIRERFEITVRAPAALVLETAAAFDLQSLVTVRAIFRLRERLMGARVVPRQPQGLLEETRRLGWGVLDEAAGRFVICGARCRPWEPDVRFAALPPDAFAAYEGPDEVKIAWTLEAHAVAPAITVFGQETRAVATDAGARRKFLRYWRWARFGIVAIRWLMLPAVRRAAERRWASEARGRPAL